MLATECDTILARKIVNPLLKEIIVIGAYILPIDSPYHEDLKNSSTIELLEDVLMQFLESYP